LAEILIVCGGVAVSFALPNWNWHWLARVFHPTVTVGLSSILLAIVGLFRDRERVFSGLALVIGFAVAVVCSIPLSV
jgi:ABC-type multidrug transport system permease subunit